MAVGKGEVTSEVRRAIHRPAPSYVDVDITQAIFETGVPLGGVGKTCRESTNSIVKAHWLDEWHLCSAKVSALLGRLTSAVGYQPTLATEMGSFQERITSTRNGSITSIQAVYVPADDMTDPAPATTFIHLDATTVLARSLAAKGIYPAVDVLDSTSTRLQPWIVGDAHYN